MFSKDLMPLVRATLKLYLAALVVSVVGVRRNYWVPLLHLLLSAAASLLCGLATMILGQLAGGFLCGLVMSAFFAAFLSTVESAIDKEPVSVKELYQRAIVLFVPVLNVAFILWVLTFLANAVLSKTVDPRIAWGLNLVVVFLFNTLPEAIYIGRNSGLDAFRASLEFVGENVVEWFSPYLVLGTVVILLTGGSLIELLYGFTFSSVLGVGGGGVSSWVVGRLALEVDDSLLILLVTKGALLYISYLVFIFRGALYRSLAGSSRRKRIYQSKFS